VDIVLIVAKLYNKKLSPVECHNHSAGFLYKYMKKIHLIRGLYALVDDEDYERVSQYKWSISSSGGYDYPHTPIRIEGKIKYIKMHRFIMNADIDTLVDHKNKDTLDNRKCNLRLCTKSENMRNRAMSKNNKSGYKGVRYYPFGRRKYKVWKAQIGFNRKYISIGYYHTKEEAALAYNEKAKELFGEFASLNTIPSSPKEDLE
jgi:hypothetical protein